jgi:hypothetical protein
VHAVSDPTHFAESFGYRLFVCAESDSDDFESRSAMMSPDDRRLLEALVVGNRDLEWFEHLLREFNLFEAMGVVRQEIRHSDFVWFLLDPFEAHGLDDTFLKTLLKRALQGREHPDISVIEVEAASRTRTAWWTSCAAPAARSSSEQPDDQVRRRRHRWRGDGVRAALAARIERTATN